MGTTLITQDLLEYASSLPAGFYSISTVGGTPNAIGVAATGYILRRTGVDAIVALYGISSGTLNVNHYDGHTWLGWLKYTTNTDLNAKALGTSNLNDIKNPGTYFQTHSGNATVDRSYPVEDAGFLEVMFAESGFILQKYNTHSSAAVYKRTYNNSGWNGWKQV